MWSIILLILISLFACIVVYRHLSELPHAEYLSYTILLLNVITLGMMLTESSELDRAIELMFLLIMLFVLVFLLISIRSIQPDYARYPVLYSYFPLIIFPFYAYFVDSEILEFITHMSIQATTILVFSGLVFTYWKSVEKGYLLFLAIILFLIAFCLYWFPGLNSGLRVPLIHLLSGAGIIIASFKFPSILVVQHKQ